MHQTKRLSLLMLESYSENWQDFIAETEHVQSPSSGRYFFAEYMVDAISKVLQYDMDGTFIQKLNYQVLEMPVAGGKKEDTTCYYSFANYKTKQYLQIQHGTWNF